jgi:hypothetical protein
MNSSGDCMRSIELNELFAYNKVPRHKTSMYIPSLITVLPTS